MLRNVVTYILGRTGRIQPEVSWSFSGLHSAFSGIVTEISVGNPSQPLRVSLNFDSDMITLYQERSCAAFVEPCHDPSASSTTFSQGIDYFTLENGGSFGFLPFEQMRTVRSSSRYSEVGGWIGASRNSPLFQSKALRIQEVGHRLVEVTEVPPDSPPEHLEIRLPALAESRGWNFASQVRLQGQLLPNLDSVKYDPGEENVILPHNLKPLIEDLFGLGHSVMNDRLLIPCETSVEFEFMLVHPGITFGLGSSIFIVPDIHPVDDLCVTRIRFDSSSSSKMVIGRILTRTVGDVTLNYKHGFIGFSVFRSDSQQFPSSPAMIPVYHLPRVAGSRVVLQPIQSPNDYQYGVILVSWTERKVRFHSIRGIGYLFIRISSPPLPPHLLQRTTRFRIEAFNRIEAPNRLGDDTIEFHLSIGEGNSELYLVFGTAHAAILQVTPSADIPGSHRVMLPRPERQTSPDKPDCPICLEGIDEGALIQRIDPCNHRFHPECLSAWLERPETPTCPMCRIHIPRIIV